MATVEPPSPAIRCPDCQSVQIIDIYKRFTFIRYFCFACGRAFEIKVPLGTGKDT